MKQLDRYIFKQLIPPFFLAFLIAVFILMMQILWKYINSILGKGVGMAEMFELLAFMSVSLVPQALPLAILISMVMVFGGLSERYELASMKSAGMSLQRIFRSAFFLGLLVTVFSYYCSNNIIPVTNLKWLTLMQDIRNQKPALSLEEGIFNYDFSGYVIKIDKRGQDGKSLEDVMIYDHRNIRDGVVNIITAEKGEMYTTPDNQYLVMELKNGYQHQELKEDRGEESFPTIRSSFEEYVKLFDLSQFELRKTNEDRYKSLEAMLSAGQLLKGIDSLSRTREENQKLMAETLSLYMDLSRDSTESQFKSPQKDSSQDRSISSDTSPARQSAVEQVQSAEGKSTAEDQQSTRDTGAAEKNVARDTFARFPDSLNAWLLEQLPFERAARILSRGEGIASSRYNSIRSAIFRSQRIEHSYARHQYEFHSKISTAMMCFIFVLIGAPMGAIIRKGGYGSPLLVSIIFFMIYIVLYIFTRQMSKAMSMDPVLAAWFPDMILFPVGLYLTYKASQDSKFTGISIFFANIADRIKKLKGS